MRIEIPDMVSRQCADAITKALIAQDGVNQVSCDLVNRAVDITCNGTFPSVIRETVQSLGYTVNPIQQEQ